jgi:uncharacterized membrane protein YbhN (UPF0104 family)
MEVFTQDLPAMQLGAIDLNEQLDRFWNAVQQFAENIAAIQLPYLLGALALSLALNLCRAHAWANTLRAAYSAERVPELPVVASFLVGTGLNGILPARGGDAVKIVLAKNSIRDSSYPAIISSFAVLTPFDTAVGILVLLYAITQGLLPEAPRLPELPAFDISFWAAHPSFLLFTVTVIGIGLIALFAVIARRAEGIWQHLKQGVAVFRDPPRYLREVAGWQAIGWVCRFASFWLFLEAFNIGGSFQNVLLVMSVQSISGALPFTPGGAGAQQALLVATLEGASRTAVLSYSVGQQVAVTAWSVAIAFVCLLIVFRTGDFRGLIREGQAARARAGGAKP